MYVTANVSLLTQVPSDGFELQSFLDTEPKSKPDAHSTPPVPIHEELMDNLDNILAPVLYHLGLGVPLFLAT